MIADGDLHYKCAVCNKSHSAKSVGLEDQKITVTFEGMPIDFEIFAVLFADSGKMMDMVQTKAKIGDQSFTFAEWPEKGYVRVLFLDKAMIPRLQTVELTF